jgi:hypothetical protein
MEQRREDHFDAVKTFIFFYLRVKFNFNESMFLLYRKRI